MTCKLDENEIRRLIVEEHKGYKEVASIMGVSSGTIRNRCLAMGIQSTEALNANMNVQLDSALLYNLRYEQGMSYKDIAKQLNIDVNVVRTTCQRYNIPSPERLASVAEQESVYERLIPQIKQMYEENHKTQREIAKELNMPLNRVRTILSACDIKTTRNRTSKYDYIDPEEVRKYYIEENHTKKEAIEHFQINLSAFDRFLDKHGLRKPKELERINATKTMQERYGVENALELPEFLERARQTNLKHRGVEWPMQSSEVMQKSIETSLRNYGTEHPMQSNEIQEQRRRTLLERYGYDEMGKVPEFRERAKQTLLQHYGVEYGMQSPEIRKKSADTLKRNYWNELDEETQLADDIILNPSQIPSIRQKVMDTMEKHYGVKYPFQSAELMNNMKRKTFERWGVEWAGQANIQHLEEWTDKTRFVQRLEQIASEKQRKVHVQDIMDYFNVASVSAHRKLYEYDCRNLIGWFESHPESKWRDWLREAEIDFNDQPVRILDVGNTRKQEIDIYIESYKIGIEINPTVTHNSTIPYVTTPPKDKYYHQKKALAALQQEIQLFHIYDWQDEIKMREMILSACGINSEIDISTAEIIKLDMHIGKSFMEYCHLQGHANFDVCYGLIVKESDLQKDIAIENIGNLPSYTVNNVVYRVIAAMAFSKPTSNHDDQYDWALVRFATAPFVSTLRGLSLLFEEFIHEYNPSSIVSYSSLDVPTSKLYKILDFDFVRVTEPLYYWVNLSDVSIHYPWYTALQNFDVIDNDASKQQISNIELMKEQGFVQVYNAGNQVFVWRADKSADAEKNTAE